MSVRAEPFDTTTTTPPKAPAFIMGLGLGGFIDGIVLHQILRWHHMLTGDNGGEPMDTLAGLETNTLIDANSIRQAGAAAVEEDRAREAPVAPAHAGGLRILPLQVEMRRRSADHHDIRRPVAKHLEGDPRLAAARVPRRRCCEHRGGRF
jgi:hypothetical protein